MSAESQPGADERAREQVRDRVQWPALFLLATAALNLLVALLQTARVVSVVIAPAEEAVRFERESLDRISSPQLSALVSGRRDHLSQADPEDLKRQSIFIETVIALLLLLPAVLALAGGVRMYQMRCYSLAVVGSLASAVPCISPMTCCCVGELVGAWCVLVLIQPQVRQAFR
jgi:hypothetical protein